MDLPPIEVRKDLCITSLGAHIDKKALRLLPDDMPEEADKLYPIVIGADGNCLSRVGSLLAYGTEAHHNDIRLRIAIELICHEEFYTKSTVQICGMEAQDIAEHFVNFNLNTSDDSVSKMFQTEISETLKKSSYLGLWQVMALSSVLGIKIFSTYPKLGQESTRNKLHRLLYPRKDVRKTNTAYILWSSLRDDMQIDYWLANHFCLLLPLMM